MIYNRDKFLSLCGHWYDGTLTANQSLQLDMIIHWLEHGKPAVVPGQMYEIRRPSTGQAPLKFSEDFVIKSSRAIVEEEEIFAQKRGRR
jgi:hypothetical protein